MYEPPYKLNSEILKIATEISSLVERFVIRLEQADSLNCARRIKSRVFIVLLPLKGIL